MRSMTETQAIREFASTLREVANGETVLVTTDQRLAELRRKHPPDPEFGDHLEKVVHEMREWMDDGVREWS